MNPEKKKKFLDKPEYPGGVKAFRKFIAENLVYPEEAKKNKVEGTVLLKIRVDDNGHVTEASVIKGIGHGCDEEALRLVKMLKYGKVKNRGVRLTVSKKVKIRFTLPKSNVHYTYKPGQKEKEPDNKKSQKPKAPGSTYTYTISY
jgi:TonB family protein